MIDSVVVAGLALVLWRGYRRGVLMSAASLVVLVAGAVIGYRAGPIGQTMVESWTGSSPAASRIITSAVVFVAVVVVGRLLISRILTLLGPARIFDRLAGAALSAIGFLLVVGIAVLAASTSVYPVPTVEDALQQSRFVALVNAQAPEVTPAISRLLGDRDLESYLNLLQLVGGSLLIVDGEDRVDITAAGDTPVRQHDQASELFDRLNLLRVDRGQAPLEWSSALADVAAGHGAEMYRSGYFSHSSDVTGRVEDRLASAGLLFRVAGENLALNPTVDGVHRGLTESPDHLAAMLDGRFTRVGISVHEGPLGLMVVEVLTG